MNFTSNIMATRDAVYAIVYMNEDKTILVNGTAFIIADGKFGVTCAHCLLLNLDINITNDFMTFHQVTIHKIDFNLDIAILNIDFTTKSLDLQGTTFPIVGDELFTLGFPLDQQYLHFCHAYTSSVIENEYIYIDGSINSGNSGSPLIDKNNCVVGIINAKLGKLDKSLLELLNQQPQGSIVISEVDPIATIKTLIYNIRRYMNVGIGSAITINKIKQLEPNLAKYFEH
jgi:hypothetical protein